MSFMLDDRPRNGASSVDLSDDQEIARLCRELGCTQIELRSALPLGEAGGEQTLPLAH